MATTTTPNDRLIRLSDYGDLASLRKAFSAAYAESLRHPERELIVAEDGTPEQQAVIASVKAERDRDARRGERSFIPEVNTRGNPCSLKRHFGPGCIRQIIGFAEKLAVNDPDRFIWIKNWSKAAKRGRNGDGGVYSATQIKRSVWGLEACQFLIPAQRPRNGQIRTGWIVARHDDVVAIDGRKCRLQAAPQFTISPRAWGQRLDEFVGGEIEVRGTVQGTVESTPGDCLGDCLGDSRIASGGLLDGGKQLDGNKIAAQVVKTVSPKPSQPSQPVKREPSHPSDWDWMESNEGGVKTTTATSTPFFLVTGSARADSTGEEEDYGSNPDSTPSKNKSSLIPTVRKSNKSVGRVADAPAAPPDLRSCLTAISGDLFEYKYIKRYEHGDELLECCLIALSEPAWRDPAHKMVRAMEMMRDQYGLNVPGGWVQVMRKLRAGGRQEQTQQPQKNQPADTYQSAGRDLIAEETTAWLERESWDDRHGTYDGFISSTPAALHRGDVRYRRDAILDHSSNEYLALADELERLEAEALNDNDEPGPDIY